MAEAQWPFHNSWRKATGKVRQSSDLLILPRNSLKMSAIKMALVRLGCSSAKTKAARRKREILHFPRLKKAGYLR